MIKRSVLALFIVLLFSSNQVGAQDVNIISGNQSNQPVQTAVPDTFPLLDLEETELDKIPDLRAQFEKLNSSYSSPAAPSENLLRFLKKDEIELSPEAQYWVNWVRDPSTIISPWATLRDTTIVNPLFTPILFKGGLIPEDLQLYDKDFIAKQRPNFPLFEPDTTLFQDEILKNKLQNTAYNYVRVNYPEYFRYSERDLPTDVVKTHVIKKATYEPELIKIENDPNAFSDVDAPVKFIPERRYWTSNFESTMQFSQNYISPNWSAGGDPNFNMNTRQYFKYDYNKDKVQVTNELEFKLNMNTLPDKTDSIHSYKINDQILRLHTLFGYKAFNKWYYTVDISFNTQVVTNYAQNSETKLSAFLAPMTFNTGIGMKYELTKTLTKVRHRNIKLNVNMAPFSYNYMYSTQKGTDMDLKRHGFKEKDNAAELPDDVNKYRNSQSQIGSKLEANMTFNINRNVSWTSRFYYFTDYHRITGEFENTFNLQISRFFSTRINLHLRYDDGVAKNEDFDSYLQINELLSFGFNYNGKTKSIISIINFVNRDIISK